VRVTLATRNPGKLRELAPLFADAGFEVRTLDDLGVPEVVEEDALEAYPTFEENALAKARFFFGRVGGAVVADDSGLEVPALANAPGVRSKRWSDRPDLQGDALDAANNALLLDRMRGVTDRSARYVCVAACVDATGSVITRGEIDGRIVPVRRGAGGFGYDPLFFSTELGRTFGEADRAEKETVSHRGRAFRALIGQLRAKR
jgi:XTP/dITP diphosphohydrolase